jgi:hypothetical protein
VARLLGDQAEQHLAQIAVVKKPAEPATATAAAMAVAAKARATHAEHAAAGVTEARPLGKVWNPEATGGRVGRINE